MTAPTSLTEARVEAYRSYVIELLSEARAASATPRAALSAARSAAEAMAKHAFEQRVGDPGKLMLEDLIVKLGQGKVLPPRVSTALRAIQAFGNLGSHAQSDLSPATLEDVEPARASLRIVESWYEKDVLGAALVAPPPASVPVSTPAPAPARGRTALVGGLAALVVVAGIAIAWRPWARDDTATTRTTAPIDAPRAAANAAVPASDPPPPEVDAAPVRAAAPIVVDLVVWSPGSKGPRALAPGAKLRTGERVAFEIRASSPAYLYLLQWIGDELTLVHAGEAPATRVRIPDGKQFFELVDDGTFGETQVLVVASAEPRDELVAQVQALDAVEGEVRRSRTTQAVVGLGELDRAGRVSRGHLALPGDDERASLSVRYSQRAGDPYVVASFSYRHDR